MSADLLDQVLWRFARRLSELSPVRVTESVNDDDSFALAIRAVAASTPRPAVYDAAEWLLSMLEVCKAGGVYMDAQDARVAAVVELMSRSWQTSAVKPSWRAGLVQAYLRDNAAGPHQTNEDGVADLLVMSEYMSLVDELLQNTSARLFLRRAKFARMRGLTTFVASERRRLLKHADSPHPRSDRVFEGAAAFLAAAGSCLLRLTDLTQSPAMRAACWTFHGDLWEQPVVFMLAEGLAGSLIDIRQRTSADTLARSRLSWHLVPTKPGAAFDLSVASNWAGHYGRTSRADVLSTHGRLVAR